MVVEEDSYFGVGGTYSFGKAEPCPKKNCSSCCTMAAWSSLRAGLRRYSFSSILQCSIHMPQACLETFSYTLLPRSVSKGGSSNPGSSCCNLTQKTLCSAMVFLL